VAEGEAPPSATGKPRKELTLLWMHEYLMALHEVEKTRLANRERKDQKKEAPSDRQPAGRDEQVYPPTNYSKELMTCP
jgi:hypothetical protein